MEEPRKDTDGVGIRIRGLSRSFGAQRVLQGLDLDVPQGAITVVIGRSGVGKSVLLKLILGLIPAEAGSIEIDGRDIVKLPPKARRQLRARFGMVFQDGALFDSMTLFDNVAFPLRELTKLSRAEISRRVEKRICDVGLEGHEGKLPSNLSGGMRKRASLARAMIRDPDFLLYDEPTTGLDPILTAQIDTLIARTQQSNPHMTSLIISHDMRATFRIAHRVAMLFEGAIIMEGTPAEVFACEDPRVKRFVHWGLGGADPLESRAGATEEPFDG